MMKTEEKYMRRALQLAKLGAGNVSPNPMVGAVIVHYGEDGEGRIIGEGYHRHVGEGHAEVNAIASVKQRNLLGDSIIYVTLEPCSHYGKTPPCAKLIIETGIPRVVVGSIDPFAKVSGRGISMLREAGVEVVTGMLEAECMALNARFMTANMLHRPYVQLKWAQSSDEFIDVKRGADEAPLRISTQLTGMWMHRERGMADAILVGAGTVRSDNPSLTVRQWPCWRQPLRVVVTLSGNLPAESKILTDGGDTLIYNRTREEHDGKVEYAKIAGEGLQWVMADLYRRGITSVMVEGGAAVANELIEQGLWDEARIEIGKNVIKEGVKAPIVKGKEIKREKHGENEVLHIVSGVKCW
jgi:diaminohydroxyphosphoribosylaminopyrimidine deaminase/5-amino-6-(5-phosphoribosylamino)uracil reductase